VLSEVVVLRNTGGGICILSCFPLQVKVLKNTSWWVVTCCWGAPQQQVTLTNLFLPAHQAVDTHETLCPTHAV
jgi:hypothetical protein